LISPRTDKHKPADHGRIIVTVSFFVKTNVNFKIIAVNITNYDLATFDLIITSLH